MRVDRREASRCVRIEAAKAAHARAHPVHQANGDEQRYAALHYPMCFTKGLEHDPATGLVCDPDHYEAFRRAVDEGCIDAFTRAVPVPDTGTKPRRQWEAPTAGLVHDLQGPDAQAVTMPPAPALGSLELAYEMAEVYELAVVRDLSFEHFIDAPASPANQPLLDAIGRLDMIGYALDGAQGRPRTTGPGGALTLQTAFRGASPGVEAGPYLSQFMLIGTATQNGDFAVPDGRIAYGAQLIDQRVPVAPAGVDYLTTAADWTEAQNGCHLRDNPVLFGAVDNAGAFVATGRRFMRTPRDLATYVHDDALYQAYLNACLILLGMGTPFDPGFAQLSGKGRPGRGPRPLYTDPGARDLKPDASDFSRQVAAVLGGRDRALEPHAGGFALYGGPHILSLVTEVATRGLKAVRYQKFNNHMRLRPEALAGRIELAGAMTGQLQKAGDAFAALEAAIAPTVAAVRGGVGGGAAFLPMAFQEGSPMHPSYGAGHATVAGACVTILKAFFDTSVSFVRRPLSPADATRLGRTHDYLFDHPQPGDTPAAFIADPADDDALTDTGPSDFLTLEGELNKLAANISIGRNMAGVHYFSDYYDSMRMGEAVAVGMLEEQALCYPTDPFILSVPTFDGAVKRIGAR